MNPQLRKQQLAAAVYVGVCLACFAAPASALPTSIFDFAMYGGGGLTTGTLAPETRVGTNVTVNGSVGSNQDVEIVGGALVTGDVLAKGSLRLGDKAQIGVIGSPVTVISNLDADLNGQVYGNVHAGSSQPGSGAGLVSATLRSDSGVNGSVFAKRSVDWTADSAIIVTGNETLGGINTGSANQVPNGPGTNKVLGTITTGSTAGLQSWGGVTMPVATSFTAGGPDCPSLTCPPSFPSTLGPGIYGTLTIGENQTLKLSSGNYYFDEINVNKGLDLYLDVSSGGPINIFVVGVANFGQDQDVYIKRPGGASDVRISLGSALDKAAASLIYLETLDRFNINSGSEWAGTVYASKAELGGTDETYVGTTTTVWGALYAYDSVDVHQDSVVNYVRSYLGSPNSETAVPEPATLVLLATGLLMGGGWRRFRGRS